MTAHQAFPNQETKMAKTDRFCTASARISPLSITSDGYKSELQTTWEVTLSIPVSFSSIHSNQKASVL